MSLIILHLKDTGIRYSLKLAEYKTCCTSRSLTHVIKSLHRYSFFILLLASYNPAMADTGRITATENAVKAAYIYNILRFVSWDASSPLAQTESLNICLYNSHSFRHNLDPIRKKVIDGRQIRISNISDVEQTSCHLIFFNDNKPVNAEVIIELSQNSNAILLGNDNSFIKHGGLFSFYIEDNKVRLAANRKALAKTRLNISSLLLEVCQLYGEDQ